MYHRLCIERCRAPIAVAFTAVLLATPPLVTDAADVGAKPATRPTDDGRRSQTPGEFANSFAEALEAQDEARIRASFERANKRQAAKADITADAIIAAESLRKSVEKAFEAKAADDVVRQLGLNPPADLRVSGAGDWRIEGSRATHELRGAAPARTIEVVRDPDGTWLFPTVLAAAESDDAAWNDVTRNLARVMRQTADRVARKEFKGVKDVVVAVQDAIGKPFRNVPAPGAGSRE